jgi:hypothetical protein
MVSYKEVLWETSSKHRLGGRASSRDKILAICPDQLRTRCTERRAVGFSNLCLKLVAHGKVLGSTERVINRL